MEAGVLNPAAPAHEPASRADRLLVGSMRFLAQAAYVFLFVAIAYSLVCLVALAGQRHLIFEPQRILRAAPADFKSPAIDVAVPAAGTRLGIHTPHGWWMPSTAATGARTVLYLHGNDGNVSTSADEVAPLRQLGYSVFLIDYSGYGPSDGGFPSEEGVYADAEATWQYLVQQRGIDSRNLFIYGHSLGGAIAIELARHHPEAAGLIVESSFTSIDEMAMRDWQYHLMPVNLLLNQRFESVDKVGELALPVLYLHGTADEVVPFDMGEELYRKSGGAKRFVAIEGGKHDNNAAVGGAVFRSAIANFIEGNAASVVAAGAAPGLADPAPIR
jgi:uncharacterized protein